MPQEPAHEVLVRRDGPQRESACCSLALGPGQAHCNYGLDSASSTVMPFANTLTSASHRSEGVATAGAAARMREGRVLRHVLVRGPPAPGGARAARS